MAVRTRKLDPSACIAFSAEPSRRRPPARARRPRPHPLAVPEPMAEDAALLHGVLAYRGARHALLLLVGSAVCGALGFGLIVLLASMDIRAKGVGAPLALSAVVFYFALLQLVLGPRVAVLVDPKAKPSLPLMAAIISTFTPFMVGIAAVVISAQR